MALFVILIGLPESILGLPMKTVSTKLTKEDFEEFQENCNDNGQCMSERLRDLIISSIESDVKELEEKDNEPVEPPVMAHGRILDDYGNVIGTF